MGFVSPNQSCGLEDPLLTGSRNPPQRLSNGQGIQWHAGVLSYQEPYPVHASQLQLSAASDLHVLFCNFHDTKNVNLVFCKTAVYPHALFPEGNRLESLFIK